mmetsp:Transcript_129077/g.210376  ORF Transcript_129077/g.210376 Transcript_129077/m.210376 type:complete len:99 (+) Transcript_129077:467-763(+)
MKYSASFLSNARLHPRRLAGSRAPSCVTDSTPTAAQCAAHKYLDAVATKAAPNAALESASAYMSPAGLNTSVCGDRSAASICTKQCLSGAAARPEWYL